MTNDTKADDARSQILDLDALEAGVDGLHVDYLAAPAYPHMVFDDFLKPEVVKKAIDEFPPLDPAQWNNYLHANERKFSNTDPETWGPTLREILAVLNSPRFVAFVGKLIGVENLVADPSLEGGGLHQSTTGGFLNVHADFTVQPQAATAGQHPPVSEPRLEVRVRRGPRDMEPGHVHVQGEGQSDRQPGPHLLDRTGLVPRTPGSDDLSRGHGPPVDGPLLLQPGG
jgi:hypothetical protein